MVSLFNATLTIGLPIVLYLLARVLEWRDKRRRKRATAAGRRSKRPQSFTTLFWAAFGLYHLGVDYNWLYDNMVALQSGSCPPVDVGHQQLISIGVWMYAVACAVTVVTNVVALRRIFGHLATSSAASTDVALNSGWRQPVTMAQWRIAHASVFWPVALASCFKLGVFKVLYCGVFGAKSLSAPVWLSDANGNDTEDGRRLRLMDAIIRVVEDLLQLVGTLLVNTGSGECDNYSDATAMTMSVVSLVLSTAMAVDLVMVHRRSQSTKKVSRHVAGALAPLLSMS